MPVVKQIDAYSIKDRLRKSGDKETLQFIKALEEALQRQQELTAKAIGKLKQQTQPQ